MKGVQEMKKRRGKGGPDPIDRYVGTRVRGRRVGMRMSQTSLGNAIGVTFQQVQKYENGTNRIGASNLYRVARALGVEVGFFYQGMPGDLARKTGGRGLADKAQADFARDPLSSRESIELMHNYFRIPDAHIRKRLFQLVKSLSRSPVT